MFARVFMCSSGRKVKDDTIDDGRAGVEGKTKAVRVKMKNFNNPKSNSNHLYLLMMRCDSNCVLASLVFLLETVELKELSRHFRRCGEKIFTSTFVMGKAEFSANT